MTSNRESSTSAPSSLSASTEARPARSFKSCGDAVKTAHKSPKRRRGLKNLFWGSTGGGGSHSGKSRKELLKEVCVLKRENAKLQQECTYTKLIYSELKQDRLVEMERTSKARARKKRILAARLAVVQDASLVPKAHQHSETRYRLRDEEQNVEKQITLQGDPTFGFSVRASGDEPSANEEVSSSSSLPETSTSADTPEKATWELAPPLEPGEHPPSRGRMQSDVQMSLQHVTPVSSRHGRKTIMVRPERRPEYVPSSQFDTEGIIIHEQPTLYLRRGSATRTASASRAIDNIGGTPVIYAEKANGQRDSRDASKDAPSSEKDKESVLTLAERMAEYGMPDMEAMGIYASSEAVLQGSLHSPPESPLDLELSDMHTVSPNTPSTTVSEDVITEAVHPGTAEVPGEPLEIGKSGLPQDDDDSKRKRSVSFSDVRDSKTPGDADSDHDEPPSERKRHSSNISASEGPVTEKIEVTDAIYESSESSLQKTRVQNPSSNATLIEKLREAASRASTVDQIEIVNDSSKVLISTKAEDGHSDLERSSKVLTQSQGPATEKPLVGPLKPSARDFLNRRIFPSKTTDDLTRRTGSCSTAFSRRRASDTASLLLQRTSSIREDEEPATDLIPKGRGAELATTRTSEARRRSGTAEVFSRGAQGASTDVEVHEMSMCKKGGKNDPVNNENNQKASPSRTERPGPGNGASAPQATQSLELVFTVTAYPDGAAAAPGRSNGARQPSVEPTVQKPSTSKVEREESTGPKPVAPEQQQIETKKEKRKKSSGKRRKSKKSLQGAPSTTHRSRKSKSSKSTESGTSKGLIDEAATDESKRSGGSVARHPLREELLMDTQTFVSSTYEVQAFTGRRQQLDKNSNNFPQPSTSDANGNIAQGVYRRSPAEILSAHPSSEGAPSTPSMAGGAARMPRKSSAAEAPQEKGSPYPQSARGPPLAMSGQATPINIPQGTERKSRHFIQDSQKVLSDVSAEKIRESSSSSGHFTPDVVEQKAPVTTPARSRRYIADTQTSESTGLRTPNNEALLPRGQEVEEKPAGVPVQPGLLGRRGLLPSFVNLVDAAKVDNVTASSLNIKSSAAASKQKEPSSPPGYQDVPSTSQYRETTPTSRLKEAPPASRYKEFQRQRPTVSQVDARPVSWEEVQSCLLPAFYKFSDNSLPARSSKSVYDLGETI